MSRTKDPSFRCHNRSGQAVVTLPDGLGGRRDVYLGKFDSEASRIEYNRVLAEWKANGRTWRKTPIAADLTVNELARAYWQWVQGYYLHVDGSPTSEVSNIRYGLRRLLALYGDTAANTFDGMALEAVRNRMIEDGLCRNRINKDVARIKRMFRWGTPKKLVPVSVYQELQTVEGLRAGRSKALETAPIRPVPLATVDETLPAIRPSVAAMVQLQLLGGMRPGEVVIMRSMDLDTSGKVWLYRPGSDQAHGLHKTAWRGQDRVIALGPRAQAILRPWLRTNLQEFLFQPIEAREQQDAERHRNRKSPMTPSQAKRRRKKNPKRKPQDRYTVTSYSRAIARGCVAADVPHWHPNQLRHTRATEIRRQFGLDAARGVLGHRSPAVTEVYAELDQAKAVEVMEKLG